VLRNCQDLYIVGEANTNVDKSISYTNLKDGPISSIFNFSHLDERDYNEKSFNLKR
jgi:hypothetical protein